MESQFHHFMVDGLCLGQLNRCKEITNAGSRGEGIDSKVFGSRGGLRPDLNFVRRRSDVRDSSVSSAGYQGTGVGSRGSAHGVVALGSLRCNSPCGVDLVVKEGFAGWTPDRHDRIVYCGDRRCLSYACEHLREDVSSI